MVAQGYVSITQEESLFETCCIYDNYSQ
jgi:hypothetical protein